MLHFNMYGILHNGTIFPKTYLPGLRLRIQQKKGFQRFDSPVMIRIVEGPHFMSTIENIVERFRKYIAFAP